MSYILDALRRADSERERGAVPGIHAQPEPLLSPAETNEPKRMPWLWIAAGGATTVAILLMGYLLGRDMPREETQAAAASAAAPVAPGPAPAQRMADSPSGPAPRALSAEVGATRSSRASAADAAAARPSPASTAEAMPTHSAPTDAAQAMSARAPRAMSPDEAASPDAARAAAPAASTELAGPSGAANEVAEPRIHMPNELPDHIRNELPAVTIGGSIYSSNPASRSLIVNGRVLREKDRVSSDLTLEEIRLKTAVLKYKGYLYEITY